MAGCLVAPECPECSCRSTEFRFDNGDHIGVIACADCGENLFVVSVLANKHVTTIKDPMAGELPEGVYHDLEQEGRLPPVAKEAGSSD